ncbi:SGNH/GDSL hydrolase family protein [Paenibacillus validus]|uniref:SGNH/GDSL hydrolase family protein n=1 Tax=Paenibacillus validus TaxID=44253 RepID=A0A7X2Z9N8_9BACL|nr:MULTISPECIES: SGNH/GDSL hydrolase family protein [Paenibacillus]MED4601663.1 SGNH/GDSL hydrolase family protein [Paenibacillus validus]MED4606226.1 SGNH/GDSL hydrolase family protein [Paenibacillus validus]MUG70836.1 SGNH/GDSL hydrolase family protein [Paenibacillus validus]
MRSLLSALLAAHLMSLASCVYHTSSDSKVIEKVRNTEIIRQPAFQYLQQNVLEGREPVISVIGSSVTAGSGATGKTHTWIHLLSERLKAAEGLEKLIYLNHGFPGYSTKQMLAQGKVDVLREENPSIIIFETCLINDFVQNISIEESKTNIQSLVLNMQKMAPKARIIITSPNPRKENLTKNKTGSSYEDYVIETGKFIKLHGWEYVDIYSEFTKQIKASKTSMDKVMYDFVHPNDLGYAIWAKILEQYFLSDNKKEAAQE